VTALDQEFARASQFASVGDRAAYWVEQFLDGKFSSRRLASLLSQIPRPEVRDSAPLIPAKFDCTTFVETAAALARSHSASEFYGNLLAIRYDHGQADFRDRNHFPVADWIPHNTQAGILRDITAEVGQAAGVVLRTQTKEINKAKWLAALRRKGKVSRSIASEPAPGWDQPIHVSVPYLPVGEVARFASKIPNGAVLNLVRSDRRTQPVVITHQGFVIQKDGSTFLRHSTVDGKLKSVLMEEYLERLAGEGAHRWPLLGVNLNQLN
jgi:hypothetical protein